MKRIALVVVVLALVVAVALPPLFGARARAITDADLAAIGDAFAPYGTLDVSLEDWDVGWYSSTATASIHLDLAGRPDLPAALLDVPPFNRTFPQLVTLHHGPIILPQAGLGWGGVELAIDASVVPELEGFQDATGVEYLLRLDILVGFLGGASLAMDVPAFVYEWQDTRFDFQGFEVNASADARGQHVGIDGEIGGFSVSEQGSQSVTVNRIDWSGTARKDLRILQLWLGGGRLDIDRIAVTGDGIPANFDVSDIVVEGGIEADEDSYVVTGSFGVGEVGIADLRLNDFAAGLAMRCGPETMALISDSPYDVGALDPEVQAALAEALLRERFQFEIDRFGFRYGARSASATLAFEYRGDELPDGVEVGGTMDLALLEPLVSARVGMAFHKELMGGLGVDQLDGWVRILAQEGILRESGDDYTLDVELDSGTLTVNGEPFEPWALLGLLSGL